MSLMRTFAMMLGEIDFLGTYVNPFFKHDTINEMQDRELKSLPYPLPAFFILGLFMVLMPILLMNLLIGLAVGDIESVRRNAQLKRLAMQVRTHPPYVPNPVTPSYVRRWCCTPSSRGNFRDVCWIEWTKWSSSNTRTTPNASSDSWTPSSRSGSAIRFPTTVINPFLIGTRTPLKPKSHVAAGWETVLDSSEDYITSEMEKQKKRLKEISSALETQQLFLRLIVQVRFPRLGATPASVNTGI